MSTGSLPEVERPGRGADDPPLSSAEIKERVELYLCSPSGLQPLVRTSGYCGFVLYSTLDHVGGGNSCGGHTLMMVATTHAG